jgi:hypothetical protein
MPNTAKVICQMDLLLIIALCSLILGIVSHTVCCRVCVRTPFLPHRCLFEPVFLLNKVIFMVTVVSIIQSLVGVKNTSCFHSVEASLNNYVFKYYRANRRTVVLKTGIKDKTDYKTSCKLFRMIKFFSRH